MRYLLFVLLLLAGCATTPQEVIEGGPRSAHRLEQAPVIAAGCLARNIENHNSVYAATVRSAGESAIEVVVRVPVADRTVSVARLVPEAKGSSAVIWTSPHSAYRSDNFVPVMVKGC